MRRFFAMGAALLLAACASVTPPAPTAPSEGGRRIIDVAAEQWVRLALEIDTHEEGYVDAYFGPAEWREQARANPRNVDQLMIAAHTIDGQLRHVFVNDSSEESRNRARYLIAQVDSALFRLSMIEGEREPFVEEAQRLFAFPVILRPLESYDATVARIEALLPGRGSPAERMDAFRRRSEIPSDRAMAVVQRAIAECRARTAPHYDLPAGESFRVEFVTGESWGAYNWYEGDNHSLIQVNMDKPLTIAAALGYGCHEGYPGHHLQGMINERKYEERGWVEFSVLPLYSPTSPLAEGGGDYGIDLAFPGAERVAFERDVLYPLAGLDPRIARENAEMRAALTDMVGVGVTIAAMYLDGQIDRERAIALKQRYEFLTRARAEQSLRFAEQYRSYVLNYDLGEALVRAYVEREGDTPEERWAAYMRMFSEPTLPTDLSP
jgi:hypothetical protein